MPATVLLAHTSLLGFVLYIKAGRISASMRLRQMEASSRKNRIYQPSANLAESSAPASYSATSRTRSCCIYTSIPNGTYYQRDRPTASIISPISATGFAATHLNQVSPATEVCEASPTGKDAATS